MGTIWEEDEWFEEAQFNLQSQTLRRRSFYARPVFAYHLACLLQL